MDLTERSLPCVLLPGRDRDTAAVRGEGGADARRELGLTGRHDRAQRDCLITLSLELPEASCCDEPMTRRYMTARLAGLAAGVLLPAGLLAGLAASPAQAQTAAQVIFGPCNATEDGQVMVLGPFLYECANTGFGWFWVRYADAQSVLPVQLGQAPAGQSWAPRWGGYATVVTW